MPLRDELTEALKAAMRAGDAPRVSAIRLINAKLKEADIAARPKGITAIPDDEVQAMLRGMIKPRRESAALYEQGHRPELAAKEMAEIAVIESFLPQAMSPEAVETAVAAAIAETGAASMKDMGKVMAALKSRHGAALDMALANPLVRAKLGA